MVDFKYTKINLLHEVNNCMCHNYYYIYYGKIYNKEHTRYRPFKYVEWFDIFDLQEYYEKETITKKDIRDYALTFSNSYLLSIKDYEDKEHLKEFYKYCNETIQNYNNIIR